LKGSLIDEKSVRDKLRYATTLLDLFYCE
jgi:hypothetical protein